MLYRVVKKIPDRFGMITANEAIKTNIILYIYIKFITINKNNVKNRGGEPFLSHLHDKNILHVPQCHEIIFKH